MECFITKAKDTRETRTALTPESAEKLIQLGLTLKAESGLGQKSGYADQSYQEKGVIVEQDDSGLSQADLVIGLEVPSNETISQLKSGSLFVGQLDPFYNLDLIEGFATSGINAISMEMIPRTTLAQKMDVLSSQMNLAGYFAVIKGAERLNKILPMMMTPAGTISPSRVFVIGVGVAGLQAIATAKRMGARVQAFDTRPVVEEQVKSLGAKFVKIDLGETGQTDQGYAKELTAEQIELQRQSMAKVCAQSDIVITTAKLFGRKAPTLLTKDMISRMNSGSVIVDLAAAGGGNVEGTVLNEEVVTENGVIILGNGSFEGEVPHHASQVYASNIAGLLEHFWDEESKTMNIDLEDEIMSGCLLTHEGSVIHPTFKELVAGN
ncbi:MAG: NAD(P)(+) transhydrogenase (Re/Si-specific) subunit alpha [Opitutaceae bacterium]|nr:NAD(P)(+) transhydrogenase (Re/Si-specific) subunit alpha [Opitutaceae bacterium]|tara:strand:- start:759 stop:1898 length:1140 start_codon:yes stop_codon:yes gene_type:complete